MGSTPLLHSPLRGTAEKRGTLERPVQAFARTCDSSDEATVTFLQRCAGYEASRRENRLTRSPDFPAHGSEHLLPITPCMKSQPQRIRTWDAPFRLTSSSACAHRGLYGGIAELDGRASTGMQSKGSVVENFMRPGTVMA
jgi:hypothetical protein